MRFARELIGEYHIETDRKGGYIEVTEGKYIERSISTNIFLKSQKGRRKFFVLFINLKHNIRPRVILSGA